MGFQLFDRRSAGRSKSPTLTVQRRGTLSLNGPAAELVYGGPNVPDKVDVELYFDPDNRLVGIKKAPSGRLNPYVMRRLSAATAVFLIPGKAFAAFHGIDTNQARRYAVKSFEGGLVGIDLKDEFVTVGRNGKAGDTE